MNDVLRDMGMGRDPRQKSWSNRMEPEDFFKYPASYPRLSALVEAVKQLMQPTEEEVRQLVEDLIQRVIWITVEPDDDRRIAIAFGTRDAMSSYSYEVLV